MRSRTIKIYRVTEIIAPYNNFSQVRPDRLEDAALRGTAVHEYLHCYALGLWSPIPAEFAGYCESGMRWLDQNLKTVISAEQEYSDPVLGFYGHPDLLMEDQLGAILVGGTWAHNLLIDYKTPVTESKSWALQLSAYHHLVTKKHKLGKKKVAPGALMLSPKGGNARFKPYYEHLDYYFGLFLGLLNALKYFEEGKEGWGK